MAKSKESQVAEDAPQVTEAPEPAKSKEKTPLSKAKAYLKKGKRFWKNKIAFDKGSRIVEGEVQEKDLAKFIESSPTSDLDKWTLDYDPVAKRLEKAKEKMKRRAGLPE